jgi:predicted AAA+ superfamily ATPase
MIHRNAMKTLEEWKGSSHRKPLILRGARQVGKTHLVREFGKSFDTYVEINFDETPDKASYFKGNDVHDTLLYLEADLKFKVTLGETLIFFDEVQEAPEVLPMLRYFYEKIPEVHVIAAGSLLEFVLNDHDFSMPVGRIEYCFLNPLTFEEFLGGIQEDGLVSFLNSYELGKEIPEGLHNRLIKQFQLYGMIGGMPEAVARWIETKELIQSQKVHGSILQTYEDDFSKYHLRVDPDLLRKTLKKAPTLVGEKIKYSNIDKDHPALKVRSAIDALNSAKIIFRAFHSDGNGIPLGAEVNEKKFKFIFLDIGLFSTALGLSLIELQEVDDFCFINRGAFAEQVIGQELLNINPSWIKPECFYWQRDSRGSNAEIDYLIHHGPRVVPVEVKAGKTGALRSLHTFMSLKKYVKALRFNGDFPSVTHISTEIQSIGRANYELLSIPFYLAGQTQRLLKSFV